MNQKIVDAITTLRNGTEENAVKNGLALLEEIHQAMNSGNQFVLPVIMPEDEFEIDDVEKLKAGDEVEAKKEIHVEVHKLRLDDGTIAWPAFTSHDELKKGEPTSSIMDDIKNFLEAALMNPNIEGVIINPWENSFYLCKDHIRKIFEANLPVKRENIVCFETTDITGLDITCIVNAANNSLLGGGGVDGAIHRAAGPELLKECRGLGGCETGEAKITAGYNLKAKHIIHTVGPRYSGTEKDEELIRNCYWNSLELARENEIHSIAFPAISTGVYGYPLEEATRVALGTVADWMKIHSEYGIAIMFACFDKTTTSVYEKIWGEVEKVWNERPIIRENNGTLEKAMQFAMEAHRGGVRKGTDKPYILHPIETLQILSSMDADTNLMAAGLLHDTIEDTNKKLLDVYAEFGTDVAALVYAHSEDKRKSWYMRKLYTIQELAGSNIRHKMLVLADKVANLRNLYSDHKWMGDEIWNRFNAPKHMQAWYYGALNDGLCELQNYPETEDAYWEMTRLYKELFVEFSIDEGKGLLYQCGADGRMYVLKKGRPQWNVFDGKVPKKAEQITRKMAERVEENWAEPFWAVHELDMSVASIEIFKSDNLYIFMDVHENGVNFHGEFLTVDENGTQLPDTIYTMEMDQAKCMMVHLRLKHGTRNKLSTVLKKEFGSEDGVYRFIDFCKECGVEFQVCSM